MKHGKTWQSAWRRKQTNRLCRCLILLSGLAAGVAQAQIAALPRADSTSGDFFGGAVAIHDNRVVVGATGVDACGDDSGAAYVYRRGAEAESWVLEARLEPDDCEQDMFFGRSVDLNERFAVIAASREFFSQEAPNAAYVFERDSTTWRQVAKLTGGPTSDEGNFATSVSLDENRVLVTSSGDPSGRRGDGLATVFEQDRSSGRWVERYRLQGSGTVDRGVFGTSGVLSGGVAAVTASTYFRNRPGSVFIFDARPDTTWLETRFGDVEDFFISVDADAERVLVGESKARRNDSGAARLFEKNEYGAWRVAQVLRPKQPYRAGAFGSAVALDGEYALVVGFDEQLGLDINIDRVVFVFKRDASTGTWSQHHVLDVGEVSFGTDLDVHGGYAVVGSASEGRSGAAYVARLP